MQPSGDVHATAFRSSIQHHQVAEVPTEPGQPPALEQVSKLLEHNLHPSAGLALDVRQAGPVERRRVRAQSSA